MKFTILVEPSLVIITILSVSHFLRNASTLHFFTPKLSPLGVGGHEIYNFSSPYPTDAT